MSLSAVVLAHIDAPPKLIASLVVLGVCLLILFFKWMLSSGSKPTVNVATPGAPFCSTCGTQARWLEPSKIWGCDRCQKPVVPPQVAPIPPVAAAPFTPSCQTCGGPGRWLVESNAWGCDRCRQLIMPPTAGQPPPPA